MDARIVAIAAEDGGRGPVLVAAGGRHRSRWAASCPASQLLERANPHVLQRIGSEERKHPTGLDAPRGGGGWLPSKRSILLLQCCRHKSQCARGAAQDAAPLPAVVAHGCLILHAVPELATIAAAAALAIGALPSLTKHHNIRHRRATASQKHTAGRKWVQ